MCLDKVHVQNNLLGKALDQLFDEYLKKIRKDAWANVSSTFLEGSLRSFYNYYRSTFGEIIVKWKVIEYNKGFPC